MAKEERPKAVLIAVKLPEVSEDEFASGLEELGRLVTTLGYDPVATITQTRTHLAAGAVLGEGKLEELGRMTGGSGRIEAFVAGKKDKARLRREGEPEESEPALPESDLPFGEIALVAVDHDISPSQLRNLEKATGVDVLDRTGVIVDIFHRHAKSREARLQVEIARLTYTAPRLRESPSGKERQAGRGAGEAALELDRRKIRDRIAELREELEGIQRNQSVRRANRKDARRVALVGYTNAGKSSLMRALTGSEVYVENKLFATLDTTVRALHPEVKPRILVSDTVGFIKKLPHDLVASFKSTLDEALEASLLLHVVDGSDPAWEAQAEVTKEVLTEIGADGVAYQLVFNKRDRIDAETRAHLERRFPKAWFVSAHMAEDIPALHKRIVDNFAASYVARTFVVPYTRQALIHEMHETGRVAREEYGEAGISVLFESDSEAVERIAKLLG